MKIFFRKGTLRNGGSIKKRLLASGVPNACKLCGVSTWRNKPLILHVDHVNGDNKDNQKENLRLLCPNCHSQTPTYCRSLTSSAKNPKQNVNYVCISCGGERRTKNKEQCPTCAGIRRRKIHWPKPENLLKMLQTDPYTTVAKALGVSDNAVRKRIKTYGFNPKTLEPLK